MINPAISLRLKGDAQNPTLSLKKNVLDESGNCYACGAQGQVWRFATVINNELAATWGLTESLRNSFDARESMFCPVCDCSFRLRLLSEALVNEYGGTSLNEIIETDLKTKKVAEINSCGKLHQFLQKLPVLQYSEFGSQDPEIPSENLEALSYVDNSLDLILTSDTLEHVPDFRTALAEIYRVLKPGGKHIFTIPTVWSRKTRQRAEILESGVSNILEPSYHGEGQPDYLVFNEFGYDVISQIKQAGFEAKIYKVNLVNLDDVSGVFIAKKPIA